MTALSDWITSLTLELMQRQRTNTTEQPLVVSLPEMIAALQEIEGSISGGGSAAIVSNGRLTLTSGVPVLTTDVIDSDDLYFTPYNGNQVLIFDGLEAVAHTFSEINLDITPLAVDTVYDIYIWSNGGTLELIAVAWTNATTRATAYTLADTGFPTNDTDITSGPVAGRGTLLGTIATDANGQLNMMFAPAAASGGSANRLDVCNLYNRVDVSSVNIDNATNYAYKVGLRQKNNSANNAVTFVCCIAEDMFEAININEATISATTTIGSAPIGYDATNAIAAGCVQNMGQPPGGGNACFTAILKRMPQIGRHFVAPLEEGNNGAGTMTWQTTTGGAGFQMRSGFTFNWRM